MVSIKTDSNTNCQRVIQITFFSHTTSFSLIRYLEPLKKTVKRKQNLFKNLIMYRRFTTARADIANIKVPACPHVAFLYVLWVVDILKEGVVGNWLADLVLVRDAFQVRVVHTNNCNSWTSWRVDYDLPVKPWDQKVGMMMTRMTTMILLLTRMLLMMMMVMNK